MYQYRKEVRTYNWWRHQGYCVKRGERSREKDSFGRPVFNYSQVFLLKKKTQPVVEPKKSEARPVRFVKPDYSRACDSYQYEGSWEETLGQDFY